MKNYNYSYSIEFNASTQIFTATSSEYPGIVRDAETPIKAIADLLLWVVNEEIRQKEAANVVEAQRLKEMKK